MALWDIAGKLAGKSVARLLGGRVREVVQFTETLGAPRLRHNGSGGEDSPSAIAAYCARMVEVHGARAFEGKVGVFDIDTEVAIVREVRAAIGDDRLLRLDANMRWSVAAARHALRRFERYNLDSIEDPVGSFEELARLRESTRVGFSSHDPSIKSGSSTWGARRLRTLPRWEAFAGPSRSSVLAKSWALTSGSTAPTAGCATVPTCRSHAQ